MQLFLLAWTGIGSVISFYLYETKQDVLLCEARPDSIKCFLFAELLCYLIRWSDCFIRTVGECRDKSLRQELP